MTMFKVANIWYLVFVRKKNTSASIYNQNDSWNTYIEYVIQWCPTEGGCPSQGSFTLLWRRQHDAGAFVYLYLHLYGEENGSIGHFRSERVRNWGLEEYGPTFNS